MEVSLGFSHYTSQHDSLSQLDIGKNIETYIRKHRKYSVILEIIQLMIKYTKIRTLN